MYPCKKCGECCRNISVAFFAQDMVLESGMCKYLDGKTNLCTIYEKRPIFCNVDAFYERFLKTNMSREEFYLKNMEACQMIRGDNNA